MMLLFATSVSLQSEVSQKFKTKTKWLICVNTQAWLRDSVIQPGYHQPGRVGWSLEKSFQEYFKTTLSGHVCMSRNVSEH